MTTPPPTRRQYKPYASIPRELRPHLPRMYDVLMRQSNLSESALNFVRTAYEENKPRQAALDAMNLDIGTNLLEDARIARERGVINHSYRKYRVMRVLRVTIISCLSLAVLGCPAARPKDIEQPDAAPLHGTFIHPSSGMTFPVKVGEFERSSIVGHNIADPDLTIRYDLFSLALSVVVTVDVYPAPQLDTTGVPASMIATARENLSHQEFSAHMREIMSSHPGAALIQQDEFTSAAKRQSTPGEHGCVRV